MTTAQQDTEITLGTGRMLAIFFAFVLVCAVLLCHRLFARQKNRRRWPLAGSCRWNFGGCRSTLGREERRCPESSSVWRL
jgi:hypothetical protein